MALGLYLLSRLGVDTPYWQMALAMLVLGLGIGSSMQVLTIVVQSTVCLRGPRRGDLRRDVLPHPRQLVRRGRVRHGLRQRAQRHAAGRGRGLARRRSRRGDDARRRCTPIRPTRSRRSSRPTPTRCTSSSSLPCRCRSSPSSWRSSSRRSPCEARREAPPATSARASACPRERTRSSSCSSPSPACSSTRAAPTCRWCASAPARRWGRRTAGPWDRSTCAPGSTGPPPSRRSAGATELPPAVLEPAFADATRHGYLVATDGGLQLTERGQDEIGKIITAMRAWLAEELSDWGVDDAALAAALGDLATRFVEESPELTAEPSALALGGGRS